MENLIATKSEIKVDIKYESEVKIGEPFFRYLSDLDNDLPRRNLNEL